MVCLLIYFFGTGIPAAILIFNKGKGNNKNVLFIDASKKYESAKNQNKLRAKDIDDIVETYRKFNEGKLQTGIIEDKFSYVATFEEIKENEFNLNIPRYVDTFEEETEVILAEEERRIHARRKRVQAALVWLKSYVMDVMRNRGIKALKTPLNTIRIQANGGLRALVIDDPAAVPDEFLVANITMSLLSWKEIVLHGSADGVDMDTDITVSVSVNNKMVRAALAAKCPRCFRDGEQLYLCSLCGGEGTEKVPGAHLAEQSESLRIS